MTVGADDFALRNLLQDALPIPLGQAPADVKALGADVIKLEDERVTLPAVNARIGLEVVE